MSESQTYLFRMGDGNDGNFPRYALILAPGQCPFAALRACVVNRYIPNCRTRRHIIKHVRIDGDVEYGIHATVYEGADGETAFDSAWLTAELQPVDAADLERWANLDAVTLDKRYFDRGALTLYRKHAK